MVSFKKQLANYQQEISMSQFFRKYLKKEYSHHIPHIKYKTNFSNCINDAFQTKGYQKTEADDWDIIWSQKQFINEIYQRRLQPHQKINHFRSWYQLCRKDTLIKNLKKHKKALERQNKPTEAQTYNFYPQTYVLPSEWVIFVDEFKRHLQESNKNIWIMKPIGRSQGKGIFLFNRLSQVTQWESHSAQNYIVQKYIADPLLIGGKKFDIRIYVLVTSFSPLTVYLYRSGFARFTHFRYEENKINNSEIHLTNVAIQKNTDAYDDVIGGKWLLDKLKIYLSSKYGQQKTNTCFYKIQEIVVKTLEAHQKVMSSDKNNSFQLYGFDVLLDSKLQPWLIQVNGSPSMTANTPSDYKMKMDLLEDTFLVIDMDKFMSGNEQQIGGFDLVCKGKSNKNNQIFVQKISFLGTYNNRLQNLKKLAKNNCNRLNSQMSQRVTMESRKPMTYTTQNQTKNGSKTNILPKKTQKGTNISRDFVIKKMKREPTNENELK